MWHACSSPPYRRSYVQDIYWGSRLILVRRSDIRAKRKEEKGKQYVDPWGTALGFGARANTGFNKRGMCVAVKGLAFLTSAHAFFERLIMPAAACAEQKRGFLVPSTP